MKINSLFFLFLINLSFSEITLNPSKEITFKLDRKLEENIIYNSPESINSQTQDLRTFLSEIETEQLKDSDSIFINTIQNSDSSMTTGNVDKIEDMQILLPNYDEPLDNQDKRQAAKDHHKFLDYLIAILSPDPFSEDPRMFLGDHEPYFQIVKKRSIVFFYLSRVILYLMIIFLIFTFIEGKKEQEEISRQVYSEKRFGYIMAFQYLSLGIILFGSVIFFYQIAEPKKVIDDTGSNLIFEFKKINVTSHEIHDLIQEINNEKVKIPIDEFGVFEITDIIQNDLKDIEQDVVIGSDFSQNMLKNPYLTNYSISLTIFFNGFLLLGLSILSLAKKNSKMQTVLYYLSGISLSFTIYTMGMFFANYSALHDICNSIIQINSKAIIPEQGIGLNNYVSCAKENTFFQQLYINLKAQNSAKKLFNNEMFKIHRAPIINPEEAIRISDYLKQIDSNSINISQYANILQKNREIIYKLLMINKCNMIKHWLNEAEGGLCLNGSQSLLTIFWIFLVINLAFLGLMISSQKGSNVLEEYNNMDIIKTNAFRKKRYNNDIKVD